MKLFASSLWWKSLSGLKTDCEFLAGFTSWQWVSEAGNIIYNLAFLAGPSTVPATKQKPNWFIKKSADWAMSLRSSICLSLDSLGFSLELHIYIAAEGSY